jgi:dienelactone hydrolase
MVKGWSEPLSLEDWWHDLKHFFGSSEQYATAIRLAKELHSIAKRDNVKLTFTGHSLGGGLATAAALATGCEAIAFAAAGVSQKTIDTFKLDVSASSVASIKNFNVQGDIVSDYNGKMDDTTIGSHIVLFDDKLWEQKQYGFTGWQALAKELDLLGSSTCCPLLIT